MGVAMTMRLCLDGERIILFQRQVRFAVRQTGHLHCVHGRCTSCTMDVTAWESISFQESKCMSARRHVVPPVQTSDDILTTLGQSSAQCANESSDTSTLKSKHA